MVAMRACLPILAVLTACQGATGPSGAVEEVAAPATGDAAAWIAAQRAPGKDLVVYVGATWCEPCRRFHDAIAAHALDGKFPRLRLLEFDWDKDGDRLTAAGYASQMLPLFALPDPSGHPAGPQIEGSIKGPGAVDEITPRLAGLIATAPRTP
jgi:thiol-disulfide isomerase/thioredoxin